MLRAHVLIGTKVKEDRCVDSPDTSALQTTHSIPNTLAGCSRIRSNIVKAPNTPTPPPLTANMKPACATQPRQTTRGHIHSVTGVAHLPDGRRIITCSHDSSLRLWEIESGTQIGDHWRDDGDHATHSQQPNHFC